MKKTLQIAIGVMLGITSSTYINIWIHKNSLKNETIEYKETNKKKTINFDEEEVKREYFKSKIKMPKWCEERTDKRINQICDKIFNDAYREFNTK